MELIRVTKRGETYTVQAGRTTPNGDREVVTLDVHASHVDGRREREGRRFLGRVARNVAEAGFVHRQ